MIQAIDQGIGGWAFNTKFLYFQKKKKNLLHFLWKDHFSAVALQCFYMQHASLRRLLHI